MTAREYFHGIHRRWVLILACVVVGLTAGWLTTEVKPPPSNAGDQPVYSATAILLGTPGPSRGLGSLATLASLTKIGEVPVRVAKDLKLDDPLEVADRISVTADMGTRLLTIAATTSTAEEAELLANTFAEELVAYQHENLQSDAGTVGVPPGTIEIIQEARASAGDPAPLEGLQTDNVNVEQPSGGYVSYPARSTAPAQEKDEVPSTWRLPEGHPIRLGISGGSGLLIGIALAFMLERYDTRLRNRRGAEAVFSFPVLSEIPRVARKRGVRTTLMTAYPGSPQAYAFRLLTAALDANALNWNGASRNGSSGSRVVLVTGAVGKEGKSTVAANLATSFAESGRSVLVMSCDLRNPSIDRLLDVPAEGGLVDAIQASDRSSVLSQAVKTAAVGKYSMKVVPTGSIPDRPASVLDSDAMRRALGEARKMAEIVILDAPALTTSSDATLLFSEVDAVLVVAHADTTAARAHSTDEILRRLRAPGVGVVVNAVRHGRQWPYYHRYGDGYGYRSRSRSPERVKK